MWNTISEIIAVISAILFAWVIWNLQHKVRLDPAAIAKKLIVSLASGATFGFILFNAISFQEHSFKAKTKSVDVSESEVGSVNSSLKFFQDEPCD